MTPLTGVPTYVVATHGAVVAVSAYMALRCCTYMALRYATLHTDTKV